MFLFGKENRFNDAGKNVFWSKVFRSMDVVPKTWYIRLYLLILERTQYSKDLITQSSNNGSAWLADFYYACINIISYSDAQNLL